MKENTFKLTFVEKVPIAMVLTLSLIAQLLTGCTQTERVETETPKKESSQVDTKKNIRAQDNFYGYVNQEQLQEMEVPFGQYTYGTFSQAEEKVRNQLHEIIEQVVHSKEEYQPGSNEQLIRDMYLQSISYEYEESGAKEQLKQAVNKIEEASNLEELIPVLGELYTKYDCAVLFHPTVSNNYYKKEENALYAKHFSSVCNLDLENIYEEESSRIELKTKVQTALYEFGIPFEEAEKRGKDTTYMLLEVAGNTDFSLVYMDKMFEKLTFISEEEMQTLFPNVDISLFSKSYGVPQNPYGGWYTFDKKQFACVGQIFKEENLENIKSYAITELFCTYQYCLSKEFQSQKFETKEEKAEEFVKLYLADELGELYAEKYFTEELKTNATEFCRDIQEGCAKKIEESDWMSATTKELLKKKLYNIEFHIGAQEPHVINPKDEMLIGENLYQTLVNINARKVKEILEQVGKPYDVNEFDMAPQTINASYNSSNRMTIPLAMLQSPMYDSDGEYAENLGKLGMTVAHELSHAFDSMGIAFDENGNYRPDWISKEDTEAFKERSKVVVDYYETFYVMGVYQVDGTLTLGENYADLGAMEVLVVLVDKKEDYEKLFESYANLWCQLTVDKAAIKMLKLDEHSPASVRVNAVLSSCEEFYDTYGIGPGDAMYRENRVSRW